MKISTLPLLTAALAASAFTVAGCDVDVDGPELPEVSVEGGEMPEVDVEMPDVTTGTTTIEVPTVGLDIPEEGDTDAGESEAVQEVEEEAGL